ncbi:MAG: hypothetical protein LBU80_02115 [Rikenellaceae bacterium]|nr:hypothetical protein [Rikenellaceae bacterium]
MKRALFLSALACLTSLAGMAQINESVPQDSLINRVVSLREVVVTGTRVPVPRDVLPTPVSVVHRGTIEAGGTTALLPVLMQQVPGLFVTSRGVAGYGVSGGAAGGINMRGL